MAKHCAICNRPLSDPESIKRGIGPDCWADMQARIEASKNNDDTTYLPYVAGSDIVLQRGEGRSKTVNVPRVFVHHSPNGFEWGYGGSGPADLAFNILLLFQPAQVVQQHYQDFKWQFIATLPAEGGTISHEAITTWLATRTADLFSHVGREEVCSE